MQVCISLQTDNHASTPPLKFFTGRMPFLPPNQQRQSTEGRTKTTTIRIPCRDIVKAKLPMPRPGLSKSRPQNASQARTAMDYNVTSTFLISMKMTIAV